MKLRELWLRRGSLSVNGLIDEMLQKDSSFLKSSILFISLIASMGLTFVSSIITARSLGAVRYGDLKFVLTVWAFSALIMTLGHFQSGGRILALEKDHQRSRELIGLLLSFAFLTGIVIAAVNALIAFPLNNLLGQKLAMQMIWLSPLVIIAPLSTSITLILQGSNRIYLLALFNIIPSTLYLIVILLLSLFQLINTTSVILSQQLTSLVVIIYVIVQLKPTLGSVRYWWEEIVKQNKTFGTQVYLGSLSALASNQINRLSISYWVDNTAIGFYSLASSLVEPLKFLPNAVATTSFRKFTSQNRISRKVLLATIVTSLISLAAALVFFGKALAWIYTKDFGPVAAMASCASFGAVLHGFGDLFNRFLGAHGKGKELRNAAYLVGVVNVIGFFLLVPRFGAWGAIITSYICVGATYFLYMLFNYLRFLHQESGKVKEDVKLAPVENS